MTNANGQFAVADDRAMTPRLLILQTIDTLSALVAVNPHELAEGDRQKLLDVLTHEAKRVLDNCEDDAEFRRGAAIFERARQRAYQSVKLGRKR